MRKPTDSRGGGKSELLAAANYVSLNGVTVLRDYLLDMRRPRAASGGPACKMSGPASPPVPWFQCLTTQLGSSLGWPGPVLGGRRGGSGCWLRVLRSCPRFFVSAAASGPPAAATARADGPSERLPAPSTGSCCTAPGERRDHGHPPVSRHMRGASCPWRQACGRSSLPSGGLQLAQRNTAPSLHQGDVGLRASSS